MDFTSNSTSSGSASRIAVRSVGIMLTNGALVRTATKPFQNGWTWSQLK